MRTAGERFGFYSRVSRPKGSERSEWMPSLEVVGSDVCANRMLRNLQSASEVHRLLWIWLFSRAVLLVSDILLSMLLIERAHSPSRVLSTAGAYQRRGPSGRWNGRLARDSHVDLCRFFLEIYLPISYSYPYLYTLFMIIPLYIHISF